MQQRVEVTAQHSGDPIEQGCTELTLAVVDRAARADLVLPPSLTKIQITGRESLDGLTLAGSGQVVSLVSSGSRSVREMRVDGVVLEITKVTVTGLHLCADEGDRPAPGVRFIDGPVSLARLSAPGRIVVSSRKPGESVGVSTGPGSADSTDGSAPDVGDPDANLVHLNVGELRVPELVVGAGSCVALGGWSRAGDGPVSAVLAERARLRLSERASVGPMTVTGPQGSLDLVSAIAERVSGVLGCLTTSGPCVVRGDGLRLTSLRCETGADVSGLVAQSLDPASLSHAAKASAFDVVLPADRSWPGSGSTSVTWWREPAAWRALFQQLEQKGRPATAAWARRMEREARRTSASPVSVEYLVLTAARLLGYGESVVRPLLAQAFVVALAWLLLVAARAYPATYQTRDLVLLAPRLYLAPLRLLTTGAFAPVSGPSVFDTVAWTVAMLSGIVCFGTAALAVKRLLAYS